MLDSRSYKTVIAIKTHKFNKRYSYNLVCQFFCKINAIVRSRWAIFK